MDHLLRSPGAAFLKEQSFLIKIKQGLPVIISFATKPILLSESAYESLTNVMNLSSSKLNTCRL